MNKDVRLLKLETRLIGVDHLDNRWEEATGEAVDEVIFLSKHVAASARPALTIHPIGSTNSKIKIATFYDSVECMSDR